MADNIDITPGVGKTVATDDCGAAGHAQVVKLAISTDGDATPIPADATYGLGVDVKRVSGNVPAIGPTAHDAAVSAAPVVTGGVASAAAPTSVSADGDVVQDWNLRNGAKAVALTAAGALIPGDATNGLDVDVTRTSIEMTDNAGFTDGTSKVVPAGYILDETVGTSLTENDVAAARIDAKRALIFAIEDKTTRGQRATVTANSSLQVDPQGNVAHDAADSGNPVKVGAKASAAAASITLVAAGDRADAVADLDGALIVRPYCQLGDIISDTKTNTDGAATAFTGSFAATANVRNYITTLHVWNSSASTVTVLIQDGSGGTTIWSVIAPAGGGVVVPFNPPLRQPTVNTALAFDGSAAASTISVSVNGFKSKC